MSEQKFTKWMKRVVRIFAFGALFLSVWFSADGFNINAPGYWWIGVFLGGLITVLEVVLNKGVKSKTLQLGGILAYIFGCYTNFLGVWAAQGSADLIANPSAAIIPAALGVLLEIIPEPLILWSWNIQNHDWRARLGEIVGAQRQQFRQPQYQAPLEGRQGRKARGQFRR